MNQPLPALVRFSASPISRSRAKRYGFALVALLMALMARLALDPLLEGTHNKHAFITFIVATTLVAWYSGFVPSVLTAVAGFLLADWFFLDPRFSLGMP